MADIITSDGGLGEGFPAYNPAAGVKDQIDLMCHPFFSLSKRKRSKPIVYDDGKVRVEVTASEKHGMATIYDCDILIFITSQIVASLNRGEKASPHVRLRKRDILNFLDRSKGGDRYQRLEDSLTRLQNTSIKTTIRRDNGNNKRDLAMFSWITKWQSQTENGDAKYVDFILEEWLFQGILDGKIITLPKAYFKITSGLERFLYRMCRKMVGTNNGELKMKLENVHKRSGLTRKPGAFQKMVEKIIKGQTFLGYWIFLVKREATGDLYVYARDKNYYSTAQEALNDLSFAALDLNLKNRLA